MLLIACSLALLVMYAGVKLMAQIQKESLGKMYCYFSWFMIISGFLMIMCIGCFAVIRCCHYPEQMMEKKYKMMKERRFHEGGMEDYRGPFMMGGRGYHGDNGPFWREEFDGKHDGYYDGQCDGYSDGCCDDYGDGKYEGCFMKKMETAKRDSVIRKK